MTKFIKPVLAQIINPVLDNPSDISTDPQTYVNTVIQAIINIFFIVAVIYFIWHLVMSAYRIIASNGDPKKYEEAQKGLINSFVGLFICFSIFGILKFVGAVFGITGLESLTIAWPSLNN